MGISYKKLRIILAERNLKATDIIKDTSLSWSVMTRINKNQSVALSSLEVLCEYFKCDFSNLVEYVSED